jgi:L-lysine exporter family protein LysE/ArgO
MLATLSPSLMLTAWLSGVGTGLGLFMVVGAQSAFIIKQGLMRAHVRTVVAVCALTDVVMIISSVLGLQALLSWAPGLTEYIRWAGVAFLAWYGLRSGVRAWHVSTSAAPGSTVRHERGAAIVGALAFTLVNPHFWLDIVMVGSIAQTFTDARMLYALGAISASLLWLTLLACGARLLAPWFEQPRAWRILDGIIAVVMLGLAFTLALRPI